VVGIAPTLYGWGLHTRVYIYTRALGG